MKTDSSAYNKQVIEWRIEGFSGCTRGQDEKLFSPVITAGNFFNTRWTLVTYPRGRKESPDFFCCFLKRDSNEKCGPEVIHVEFEFQLLSFDRVAIFRQKGSGEFKRGTSYGHDDFVKLEDIFSRKESLLTSNTLTLLCKMQLVPPKKKPTTYQVMKTHFEVQVFPSMPLELDNFRNINKQNPRTLPVRGFKDLLVLKVSMNKDKDSSKKQKNITETKETFLRIVMVKKKSNDPVHVTCCVRVLDTKLESVVEKEVSHLFPKSDRDVEWVLPYFIDTSKLGDDCIVNDGLKLDFDFNVCNSESQSLQTADLLAMTLQDDPRETTLMEDLADLYRTKKFSDVTLRAGNRSFAAHKSVLAARSKRFEEILSEESTSCENQVEKTVEVDGETGNHVKKTDDVNEETGNPVGKTADVDGETGNHVKKTADVNEETGNPVGKTADVDEKTRNHIKKTVYVDEKTGNHVKKIADINEETMEHLLKFIYTDKIEVMSNEKCLLLYSAAQKYKIPSLQFRCARYLRVNLSAKEIYKALLFAEEFRDSELKMAGLDFMLEHHLPVLLTPEWQKFTEEHRELSEEVMRYLRLKKSQQEES